MAVAESSRKLQNLRDINLVLGNETIQKSTDFKYLGITIDNCLNFNKHFENLKQSVIYKIYLLNKIRCYMDEEASLKIYKAMILPLFTYGDVIYSATSSTNLDALQVIQNRGLKTCLKPDPYIATTDLHRSAHVNKLDDLRKYSLTCFTFKRTLNPKYVDQRSLGTRSRVYPVLKADMKVHSRYLKSVQFRCYDLWSKLDITLKQIDTYPHLKEKLKIKLDALIV